MLRLETETGWWLVTHPDHARLAGAFAEAWGNTQFVSPLPRENVLLGIRCHDDGWAARDAHPQITRQGKPSAFSTELVGKYSAFEEIDLEDYLAVRDRAVRLIAGEDPYAGLLVSMHTYNLLSERADRSTIRPEHLPLLDTFLEAQAGLQQNLTASIRSDARFSDEEKDETRIRDHFRLLQATDNLSLLSCVGFMQPATLLHPLLQQDGGYTEVAVRAAKERTFRLHPYPFGDAPMTFEFPARHVEGKTFEIAEDLQRKFRAAPTEKLSVTVSP
jgi:Protein of unknown function (DUF3891)